MTLKIEPGRPLAVHRATVRPEWIDYNGHMNVAFYVLAFDEATDALFDFLGFDEAYRQAHNVSTFALEAHVCYLAEVAEGDTLRFEVQILDRDGRFFHHFTAMYREPDGLLAATAEWLSVHVDMGTRKPAPMRPDTAARFDALWQAHKNLPRPEQAGRVMGIRRK